MEHMKKCHYHCFFQSFSLIFRNPKNLSITNIEDHERIIDIGPFPKTLKPLSVTYSSVGSQKAAAGNVGADAVAHLAHSYRSRTDASICNRKGLYSSKARPKKEIPLCFHDEDDTDPPLMLPRLSRPSLRP